MLGKFIEEVYTLETFPPAFQDQIKDNHFSYLLAKNLYKLDEFD